MFARAEPSLRDTIVSRDIKNEGVDMISYSFAFPSSNLTLSTDEIHIWLADLDQSASQLSMLIETLSLEECMRAKKYYYEKDSTRFLLGRGILRAILGFYLQCDPGRLHFRYGKNGKPALAAPFGDEDLHFNLSHAQGVALYAFTRQHEIGVDIEYMSEMAEMELIAERFFSRNESDSVQSLPEELKKEAYFKGWTCKEAFIKALGDGMSHTLDKFEVSMVPDKPAKLLGVKGDSGEASRWSIQNLKPAPNYVGAFAVKNHMFTTKYWRWNGMVSVSSPSLISRR